MTRCHLSSFHQDSPKTLVKLQDAHWKPLLSWIRDELGLEIRVHESIFSADQPEETKIRLGEVVKAFDEWQLAGTSSLNYCELDSDSPNPQQGWSEQPIRQSHS